MMTVLAYLGVFYIGMFVGLFAAAMLRAADDGD